MGMFENIRKKATTAVDQHGGKIAKGIDSAGAAASKRTGGKYDAKITKGSAAAKKALDRLDRKNDDLPDEKPAAGRPEDSPATPPARPDAP